MPSRWSAWRPPSKSRTARSKTFASRWGGVAHKPWRALEVEQALTGANADVESFGRAAEAELAPARGLAHNGFKIELAKRTIVGVLSELAERS
jgi:CO/xanthine dehydrogenase FAD-binding subunit